MMHIKRSLVFGLVVAATALPTRDAQAAGNDVIVGPIELFFTARPATDGSKRVLPAQSSAPVTIRLKGRASAQDLSDLAQAGAKLMSPGRSIALGDRVSATVDRAALAAVAKLPRVRSVTPDGSPFPAPRPLDVTALEVHAPPVWASRDAAQAPLTGHGVTICDVDSGIDVFHPLFFRADGGYYPWIDVDEDGVFTPGVDGIDTDNDGAVERIGVLDTWITPYYSGEILFGSDDPAYDPGIDYLYIDKNGDGQRNFGPKDGFTEDDPTYGERLLVGDDVNDNGKLDVGEKIAALGSTKIRAVRLGSKTYRHGANLIDVPVADGFDHGSGASGILVGGNRGLTRLVGIAPDAELVMAVNDTSQGELALTRFCVNEGARVVLHEYAPWQGYHLDGSSAMEQYIDATTAEGVSHINPAGNLATGDKLYKATLAAGVETVIPVLAPTTSPYGKFRYIGLSLLWRDPARNLAVTLEDPTGHARLITTGSTIYDAWHDGLSIYAERVDSDRGTARVDAMIFDGGSSPGPIPLGTWKLRVVDPYPVGSPGVEVIAYVQDDLSGWGRGIYFTEHVSLDHLIGYPGTADHGLPVSAYTGHDFDGGTPGLLAAYSGRGRRIDGQSILAISAPDNPISAGYRATRPAIDFVFGGTSGASPHVAGAAALLIQADPSRTGDDVRAAIEAGALADDVVGAAPNDDYGYGKLRVYESIFGKAPPDGVAPSVMVAPISATVGLAEDVPILVAGATSAITLDLDRDYDGAYDETLAGPSFSVSFDAVGTYYAKVRATDEGGRTATALAVITVREPEPKGSEEPDDPDKPLEPVPTKPLPGAGLELEAGGGTCAIGVASDTSSRAAWWMLALGIATVGRRRHT